MNNSRSDVRFIIRLKITLFFCFFFMEVYLSDGDFNISKADEG